MDKKNNTAGDLIRLDAREIDLSGDWILWPREPDNILLESLQTQGQLQPVLVQDQNPTRLISGYSRVLALRELERDVLAIKTDMAGKDPGLVYVQSNCGREPATGQKIAALRYCRRDTELLKKMYPALGIDASSREHKLWEDWLGVEEKWDSLLSRDHLPLRAGVFLAKMDPEDREVLYPFFRKLSWSQSNALKFFTWLIESARMQEGSPAELIREKGLEEILSEGLSPKDATSRIINRLYSLRYPHVAVFLEKKDALCREITAGTGWRAAHTKNLESAELSFCAAVNSTSQMKKLARELAELAESGAFEKWLALRENTLETGGTEGEK
jgi:hypothetical protein